MFEGLENLVTFLLILVAVIAALFGMFLAWVLPKVWAWLAPIIHAATG